MWRRIQPSRMAVKSCGSYSRLAALKAPSGSEADRAALLLLPPPLGAAASATHTHTHVHVHACISEQGAVSASERKWNGMAVGGIERACACAWPSGQDNTAATRVKHSVSAGDGQVHTHLWHDAALSCCRQRNSGCERRPWRMCWRRESRWTPMRAPGAGAWPSKQHRRRSRGPRVPLSRT